MSACWRSNPDNRPSFDRLTQRLRKILEIEEKSDYIDFCSTNSLSLSDTESLKDSEREENACALNLMAQNTNGGESGKIRYVVGSALTSVKEDFLKNSALV